MDHFRAWIVTRLPLALRGARLSVGRRAAFGLCLVVLLAVGAAVALVIHGRAEPATLTAASDTVDEDSGAGGSAGTGHLAASRSRSAAPTPSTSGAASGSHQIVVDVEGKVAHPGVHLVSSDARIHDVISAAGGALPGVDLTDLDLAERVSDGEQIRVGLPGAASPQGAGSLGGAGSGMSGAVGTASLSPAEPVDLNAATAAQLDALPGIGPALAARIIAWRAAHGDFTSVQDLGHVPGLGGKKLASLAPLVRV